MNNIRLFIEGEEVELNSEVTFAITRQFEEITNPTILISDWSKTVNIPFTANNNRLFGHIYSADKVLNIDSSSFIGVHFNPYKKLDFRLEWNDAIVMSGYAKMVDITRENGYGTYNITLNGELGKVFQEFQKITFDTSSQDTEYIIDGSTYVDTFITKSLVKSSWESTGQQHYSIDDASITITDIIGFAPNNSFNDNFDYKTYQSATEESKTFVETLDDSGFSTDTGISSETIIGDGLLPRSIGEYRSYMQLPFIYFNKLFQIFQKKAEAVTGYQFDLDETWFNINNPYWYKLVYMLQKLDFGNENIKTNYYNLCGFVGGDWRWDNTVTFNNITARAFKATESDENVPIAISLSPLVLELNKNVILSVNQPMNVHCYFMYGRQEYPKNWTFWQNCGLEITVNCINNDNNQIISSKSGIIVSSGTIIDTTVYDTVKELPSNTVAVKELDFNEEFKSFFNYYSNYEHIRFSVSTNWLQITTSEYPNTHPVPFCYYTVPSTKYDLNLFTAKISTQTNNLAINMATNYHRSYGSFTLNDLWNNEYNLFNEILNYCKMYRIGITTNESTKTIRFVPLSKFFSEYTYEDWTNKLDMSQQYLVKPISWEHKYVKFNYEDESTSIGKQYSDKYGVNFGEKKLITDYNFDTDSDDLFSGIKSDITNTDNVLSWKNLYENHKIIYGFPDEIFVSTKDDDKKYVDCFGRMFFHNGLRNFNTESSLELRPVTISDDTSFQWFTSNFFYSQSLDETTVTTYPYLDVINNNNLCIFNTPQEVYTYNPKPYENCSSLYDNMWNKYIEERYNPNNKVITCYLRITPNDYINFSFNKLIMIDNQLYVINKIYDYNVSSSLPTKCDLITIQDVAGYMVTDYSLIVSSIDSIETREGEVETFNLYSFNHPTLTTTLDDVYISCNGRLGTDLLHSGDNVIELDTHGSQSQQGTITLTDGITTKTINITIE